MTSTSDAYAGGHLPGDVVLVAFGAGRAADQQELIGRRESGDGDVGLVGATGVEHPGVDGPARGDRDMGGAQPLQVSRTASPARSGAALLEDQDPVLLAVTLGIRNP